MEAVKTWIPFENQNNAVAKLKKQFPKFFAHLNEQLGKLDIPIAFDYESEIFNDISTVVGIGKPIGSFPRLWEFQKKTIARYRECRLIYLEPTAITTVNGVLGVECINHADTNSDLWIPKSLLVVGGFYPTEANDFRVYNTYDDKQLTMSMNATLLYSFIAKPFN